MSKLDEALARLREHGGVEQIILLGRDGLVVQQLGAQAGEDERVAARIPGLLAACEALGAADGKGAFMTSVIEFERGVAIVLSLSPELSLAVLLEPGIGFAPLLRELRNERRHLLGLL